MAAVGAIVNEPGTTTVTPRPAPTTDADTDSPSPATVNVELALPAAVGLKTIVTAHVAPGARDPPHALDVMANGAAGGTTEPMLIGTLEVFFTTALCAADCAPTLTVPKSTVGVMSSAIGRSRIHTFWSTGIAVPASSLLAKEAKATYRPFDDIDGTVESRLAGEPSTPYDTRSNTAVSKEPEVERAT